MEKKLSTEECFNYSLKDKRVRNEHDHKLEPAKTFRKKIKDIGTGHNLYLKTDA